MISSFRIKRSFFTVRCYATFSASSSNNASRTKFSYSVYCAAVCHATSSNAAVTSEGETILGSACRSQCNNTKYSCWRIPLCVTLRNILFLKVLVSGSAVGKLYTTSGFLSVCEASSCNADLFLSERWVVHPIDREKLKEAPRVFFRYIDKKGDIIQLVLPCVRQHF